MTSDRCRVDDVAFALLDELGKENPVSVDHAPEADVDETIGDTASDPGVVAQRVCSSESVERASA